MQFDRHKVYPYPVLRPYSDDYSDSEIQTIVDFEIDGESIQVEISYQISCDEILEEIKKGNAAFVCIVSCRDTYFQKVIQFSGSSDTNIEKFVDGDLRGAVEVNSYITAVKKIPSFKCKDINDEFGAGPFRYEVGDLLAQDETQVFFIDRDMFKPISSVFQLVKKDGMADDVWTINFGDEKVQIEMSQTLKEKVENARNSTANRAILLNSIYFAAVMEAIQKLKDRDQSDIYKDTTWGKIILAQAHNEGLDINSNDSYYMAEKLMKHPINRLTHYVFGGSE